VIWTVFLQSRIVSVISFSLMHGPTTYLIGEEFIQCLVDVLMQWTLESQLTSIPIEHNMHDMIVLGIGTTMDGHDPDDHLWIPYMDGWQWIRVLHGCYPWMNGWLL